MMRARGALIAFMVAFGVSVTIAAVTTIRQVHIGESSVSQPITRS
jgi:hypothetical protein